MLDVQKVNLVIVNKYAGMTVWTFEDTMQAMLQSLTDAGYRAAITTNYIEPGAVNILFGVGSVFSHSYEEIAQMALPSSTIIFNGEQIDSTSSLITPEYLEFLSRYVVLDWCQPNIYALQRKVELRYPVLEMPQFPTVNLGSSTATGWQVNFDLAFYGAVPPRRRKLIDELTSEGVSIKHISGRYGQQLADELLDCRYVLNIHAYETDLLEINRCLRPMAMGIPVLSEASSLPASGDWNDSGVIFLPTEGFGRAARRIIDDPDQHLVAARKAVQFTHRPANAIKVRQVLESAIAALPAG